MDKQKNRVIKPYQRLEQHFQVIACTFGSTINYRLQTINVSTNGILTGSGSTIPFCVNTLLEMLIDPRGEFLQKPIPCIGKVVRLAREDRQEADFFQNMFGISISETSEEAFKVWESYLSQFEGKGA